MKEQSKSIHMGIDGHKHHRSQDKADDIKSFKRTGRNPSSSGNPFDIQRILY